MARIRTIKPEFFKNEDLSELEPILRLLFIGLWTQCDREGKLEDRPKRLKIEIFPYDDFDINYGLNLLHEKGFIVRYNPNEIVENDSTMLAQCKDGARKYIKILTFKKHQQPNIKEAASTIPDPVFTVIPYEHSASTVLASQEGKGKDSDLINKIMKNFNFNEISNFDKLREISSFIKCIEIADRVKYFEEQMDAYFEYKTLTNGLEFIHKFNNFLGSHDKLFTDGAWNQENWVAKLQTEKTTKNGKKNQYHTAGRSSQQSDGRASFGKL
jgi:hypothetical protein